MVKRTRSRKGRGGGDWAEEAARINAALPPRRKKHVVNIADMVVHNEPSLAEFESKLAEKTGAVEPEQFSQGLFSKLASKFTKKSGGRKHKRRASKKHSKSRKRGGRKSRKRSRSAKRRPYKGGGGEGEKILAERKRKGGKEYQVSWEGDTERTWEPARNLPNAVLRTWWKSKGGKRRGSSKH